MDCGGTSIFLRVLGFFGSGGIGLFIGSFTSTSLNDIVKSLDCRITDESSFNDSLMNACIANLDYVSSTRLKLLLSASLL